MDIEEMSKLEAQIHDLAKGVKRKGQPGYHRVQRPVKDTKLGTKMRWQWVHESELHAHERPAPAREPEAPSESDVYKWRTERAIAGLKGLEPNTPEWKAEMSRIGTTGAEVVHRVAEHLTGARGKTYDETLGRIRAYERDHAAAKAKADKRKPKGTPTRTNVYALHDVLRQSADGLVPQRLHATDHPHVERCLRAGLIEPHEGGKFRLTRVGWNTMLAHGFEPSDAAKAHVRGEG